MKSYRIHLIRHGVTVANEEGRYAGKSGTNLSENGRADLLRLMESYEYPYAEWVVSSPAAQAVETAELLYPEQGIRRDERWREMDFGVFDGKSLEQLASDERYAHWIKTPATAPPEGESSKDVFERVLEGLESLYQDMMQAGVFSAAVVTHGGIISGLLATLGLPRQTPGQWTCPPGQGYTIFMTPQMWMRTKQFEVFSVQPLERENDFEDIDPTDLDFEDEEDRTWA